MQTLSEIQAGGDLSDAAMNDLWLHDHQFVADRQRERSTTVEKQLVWLDGMATGDPETTGIVGVQLGHGYGGWQSGSDEIGLMGEQVVAAGVEQRGFDVVV